VEVADTVVKTSKSGDGLTLLKSLVSNVNSRQPPKRPLFTNMPFEIAPGLTISIKGYMPLHKQEPARTCFVSIDGEKPLLAHVETAKVERSSGRALQKTEIVKGYKFGQELIEFTPDELKGLRRAFGEPVLRIIGFKPRSMLPSWASISKSTFIYPSEDRYVGSTRVFSALWQKLLKDDKIGIAWHIARKSANPVLVAILASKHDDTEDSESGVSFPPSGMWLYRLPFADDLREIQPVDTTRAPDEVIDQMRVVVQNLQLPKAKYNPQKYPNPSLQWHYKILQTLALEEEMPEHPDDLTLPKYRQIDKRVGGYLEELKQSIVEAAGNLQNTRALKREAEDDGDERPTKRAKAPATKKASGSMNDAQLRADHEQDGLKGLKVAELKDILASKGLTTTGKKADLLERLEQWIEGNS
jgi:ATP-dependent DNA helicase 2 subunit 1